MTISDTQPQLVAPLDALLRKGPRTIAEVEHQLGTTRWEIRRAVQFHRHHLSGADGLIFGWSDRGKGWLEPVYSITADPDAVKDYVLTQNRYIETRQRTALALARVAEHNMPGRSALATAVRNYVKNAERLLDDARDLREDAEAL